LLLYQCHILFNDANGPSVTLKVAVILNKRRYQSINQSINKSSLSSREIAVFDMSTDILHNTFTTTTPLIDAIVNETLPLGDYRLLQFFHRVNFRL